MQISLPALAAAALTLLSASSGATALPKGEVTTLDESGGNDVTLYKVSGAPTEAKTQRALNSTGASACPSAYGPGRHTVEIRIPDAINPAHIWVRQIVVFVPEAMPLAVPRPSMLMWHGCGSDPEKFEEESEMAQRVGNYQYYAVYPRGSTSMLGAEEQYTCISEGGTRCGWNSGFPNEGGCQTPTNPRPDDVQFAEIVMEWMQNNLCVNMDRIFIAGFSNGGSMAYKLNCLLSQRFAGMMTIGSAAGTGTMPGVTECNPQRKLPAINFCGSTDGCYGSGGVRVRDQLDSFANWVGCTGASTRRELSATTYCYSAEGCPAGLPVQGCGITGLGHCWPNFPGAGDAPCQNQNPANLDASTYILEFFNSLPGGSHWD